MILRGQIRRNLHVGQQALQHRQQRRGIHVPGTVRTQFLLVVGRCGDIHLPDRLLDPRVHTQRRVRQHSGGLLVQRQFHGRVDLLEHLERRLGRSLLNGIRDEHGLLRRVARGTQRLDQRRQFFVLGGLGPDRQLAGLRVFNHAHARKSQQQIRLHGLKARPLRGARRVETQHLLLHRTRVFGDLFDRPPHDLLVFGRGDHHQPATIRIRRDLGRRDHGGQHRRNAG